MLYPRRVFIAALVLATKFIDDAWYKNGSWGELMDVSGREVSLWEHELGEALNWRLWVGKSSILP
ncbi:hypothetical protein PENSPDRAFT_590749 [Peniophora sp. CONT]|nr:hypothetical protein PENSPDRAFT_590749 [Peniophora sp. CONT]